MKPKINLFNHSEKARPYPAGVTIFREGFYGKIMYVVVEGYVDVIAGGRLLETVGPGGILGEMSLIDPSEPRSATIITRTDCKLVEIDEPYFNRLIQETPYFAMQVMQIVVERLRRMNRQFASAG